MTKTHHALRALIDTEAALTAQMRACHAALVSLACAGVNILTEPERAVEIALEELDDLEEHDELLPCVNRLREFLRAVA